MQHGQVTVTSLVSAIKLNITSNGKAEVMENEEFEEGKIHS